MESHLLQMRGLKLGWSHKAVSIFCRIFYRCVDWNCLRFSQLNHKTSRIFYRCVDWNPLKHVLLLVRFVASFTDAWIETDSQDSNLKAEIGRIFYRCVDWNYFRIIIHELRSVASFTDAWIETMIVILNISVIAVASFTDAWIETWPASLTEVDS